MTTRNVAKISVCVFLLLGGKGLFAQDVRKGFESLFGAEAARAASTPATADDAEFAARLLSAVTAARDYPALQALLYEKAYEFGSRGAEGYATAAAALEGLMLARPEDAARWEEKYLDVLQLRYTYDKSRDKSALGGELLSRMIAVADRKARAAQATDALALYRKAAALDATLKSDRKSEIQAGMKDAIARQAVERRLATIQKKFEADPANVQARMDLILFHVVQLDNPAEAARLADVTVGELLQTYLPLAARPVDQIQAPACLELAQWYESLAASADAFGKAVVLARARDYYERFLALHQANDMDQLKAKVALERASKTLAALEPAKPEDARGKWFSLLASPDRMTGWGVGWESTAARNKPVRCSGGVVTLDGYYILYHSRQEKNMAVRARVNLVNPGGGAVLCVRCGSKGRYSAIFSGQGQFRVGKMVGEGGGQFENLRHGRSEKPIDNACEMVFAAVGKKLVLYADGEKVIETEDDSLTSGSAGIGASRAEVQFRDLQMMVPPEGWTLK